MRALRQQRLQELLCWPTVRFLNTVIDFLIMAFIIFLMVRFFNNFNKKEVKEEAPKAPTTKVCPYCMSEISVKRNTLPTLHTSQL